MSTLKWDFHGIDTILNQLIEYGADIAGGIAEGIVETHKELDNQADKIINTIDSSMVGGIANNTLKVLDFARDASSRKDILIHLSLLNNANNFENYIQPLVSMGWLTMTIPDKPTSPNQQYLNTLKGRLIVKFLKLKKS